MIKILGFVFLILFAFAQMHFFVYLTITRSIQSDFWLNFIQILFFIFLAFIPLGFAATKAKNKKLKILTWVGYTWLGVFTILFFFSLIEISLLLFFTHNSSYWVFIIGSLVSFWSLFRGFAFPTIVTHEFSHKNLSGFSLVQLSDLHIGMLHLDENWLRKVIETVCDLKPHVLVITGDLVEGSYNDVEKQLKVLSEIKNIPHKFFITGNHEYIHGGAIWEEKLNKMGFQVLHNTNEVINFKEAQILIAGVPDRMIKRFTKENLSQPDRALKSAHNVDYKILLAHQPSSVHDIKVESCDLILCGHTHGGQIFPFHLLVRSVQPVVTGFKTIKNMKVFAHQGTGLWGPPMRWFSQNEIVVFKWK